MGDQKYLGIDIGGSWIKATIADKGLFDNSRKLNFKNLPVGTGIGFSVWRNGRRWRPGKRFLLLGSIRTPSESFDSIVSATRLANPDENNNLINVLTNNSFKKERELVIFSESRRSHEYRNHFVQSG